MAGSGAARIASSMLTSEFTGAALRLFLDGKKGLPKVSLQDFETERISQQF